jgi:hypothetical protein
MKFGNVTAAVVVLAVTTALAQRSTPVTATVGGPVISQRNSLAGGMGTSSLAGNKKAGVQTPATLGERVQDMEGTLAKMHAVLRQMRTKSALSSKDPLAKANLDMWELMVGHLDRQLQELRVAMIAREDFEARRAAMYKQADAKADAEARAARNLRVRQAVTAAHAGQGPAQSPAGQTEAGQTPPAANTSTSPK